MTTISLARPTWWARFTAALERSAALWGQPLQVMILSLIIYTGISITAGAPWRLSNQPYYNYLADAFMHGQLNLMKRFIITFQPINRSEGGFNKQGLRF